MATIESTASSADSSPRSRPVNLSISEGLKGHRNSLGVLRLVLATLVIFSHAFPLGGWGSDPGLVWSKGQESIGGFAVVGFFAISGYLIAKSGANADIVQFMWRRVLRIFPAFWLVLLVGAGIVGPIAWMMEGNSFRGYLSFNGDGPVSYLLSNWDLIPRQYGIYDIFTATTPYGQLVGGSVLNGSLWTLSYEWGCYMIIAVLVLFGVLRRARFLVLVLTAFYYVAAVTSIVVPGGAGTIFPDFGDRFRISLALIFLLGSCLALYSKEIKLDDRLGIFAAFVVCATLLNGGWLLLGYPALAYFLLWFAARLPTWVQWIGAKNDYSYGMYVYGFLVQQFTAYLGWYKMGYVPWVIVTIIIAAGCAWLSWHLVEKRALALKDWGPGRGIRHWYEKTLSGVDWLRHRRTAPSTE